MRIVKRATEPCSEASGARRATRHFGRLRRTKIICTIGPASESEEILRGLIGAGMNLARLNFSHGTHTQHRQVIRRLRRLAQAEGTAVGIVQDLRGPKLRIGRLGWSPMKLAAGDKVKIGGDSEEGAEAISIGSEEAVQLLRKGDSVLLDDGRVELEVERKRKGMAHCRAVRGGEVETGKGVNLPTLSMALPSLTEKDIADLEFGLRAGVDWVALSFVRRAEDIEALRAEMKKRGKRVPIIAKIEKPQAIEHLDEIIEAADGVMVARGDLGVEMPLEQVPLLQKRIIEQCTVAGKPAIVATQMLESMIHAARPTRAEVSDVANAILDGADAVMLSGETAVGEYPLAAAKVMDRVARETEKTLNFVTLLEERVTLPCKTVTDAISQACGEIAQDLDTAAIITSTSSGHTAAMVSRNRPAMPLLAITPDQRTLQRLTMWWGVRPILVKKTKNTDEMVAIALKAAKGNGLVKSGDKVVITAGVPPGVAGNTNLIKVETVK